MFVAVEELHERPDKIHGLPRDIILYCSELSTNRPAEGVYLVDAGANIYYSFEGFETTALSGLFSIIEKFDFKIPPLLDNQPQHGNSRLKMSFKNCKEHFVGHMAMSWREVRALQISLCLF